MKKLVLFAFALFVLALGGAALAVDRPDGIGSLYSRTMSGDLQFTCTASVVDGARFGFEGGVILTAAHCVDGAVKHDAVTDEWRVTGDFMVTFNEQDFYGVRLARMGFAKNGYDLAVLEFGGRAPTVTALPVGAWSSVRVGDNITNWGNPMGIGMQFFRGMVSMLSLERPVETTQLAWRGYAVGVIAVAGGSSGSLILNDDGEVIGVLVGTIQARTGSPFVAFVPESRFAAFMQNDAAGVTLNE